MTIPRSIAFSRATASAICNSSSRFALTAIVSFSLAIASVVAAAATKDKPVPRIRVEIVRARAMRARLIAAEPLAGGGAFRLGFRFGCALRRLGAAQRFCDQRLGKHELRLCHVGNPQQDLRRLSRCRVLAANASELALDAQQDAPKSPPS